MGLLTGKVAIITASSEGIGYAIVKRFLKEGAMVVFSSRNQENVTRAIQELNSLGFLDDVVLGLVCHVSNEADRKNLFAKTVEKFGGLDILISNAGTNPHIGPLMDCTVEAWDKTFDVNLRSSFLLSQLAVDLMKVRGSGIIVYVSSVAGYNPYHMIGPYAISKTALLGLTKAASTELAPQNIRVNCIAPGVIETKMAAAVTQTIGIRDDILRETPMGRFGVPDEVAGVALFLCSADASYITGENIVVSGGLPSRL